MSMITSKDNDVFGVPFVEILEYPIDREAALSVSAVLCRRHRVLPIAREGMTLIVAMADPGDILALDDVSAATRRRARPVAVDPKDLATAIDRYHRADDELSDLSNTLGGQSEAASLDEDATDEDDAPIVRFVNLLISQAVQDRASDIHVEPGEKALRVRYRIDGVLKEVQSVPTSIQAGVISRLKIMAELDIAERRRPQDGRIAVLHQGRKIDLRVATLPTVYGEKVVMRILDSSGSAKSIGALGMMGRNLNAFKASYERPNGMLLVTGPTGSGKSTTLYTAIQEVAKPSVNVITVEDPVEYRMAGINQVQINAKAGLTFASALRSILRSDPDVVLIGEIRDHETAQIAVEAALTGHLVMSTLHTNDAPSAVTRLVEMGIEPYLVGSALVGVVAQRLARRLCDKCKKPTHYDEDYLAKIGLLIEEDEEVFVPVGCSHCANTGYRGRLAIHEVMTVSEEVERLTVARSSASEIGRAAVREGMVSLRQDGWNKVAAGLTSIEEVLRVAV
ncbi:GspE/PulE family protein [Amnibacterium endophyticum]|uniref:GspE/PulE family protein n=1 Tax=Amnibacterium endophyticum TaxID=2109337 RepID=A0ABW4LGQ6_9MICO